MSRIMADMKGKQFNRLTVRELAYIKNNRTYWLCDCSCGNTKIARQDMLIGLKTQSCGCLQKEQRGINGRNAIHPKKPKVVKIKKPKPRGRKPIDLKGKHFRDLEVIERAEQYISPSGHRLTQWKCRCKCGKIIVVPHSWLTSKDGIINCGCDPSYSFSRGERKIARLLDENNIKYSREKTFDDCILPSGCKARFDFYVNDSYLIEFDGEQHFHPTGVLFNEERVKEIQLHDDIKNKYCIDHNIILIRIPYNHFNKLCIEDLMTNSKYIIKT